MTTERAKDQSGKKHSECSKWSLHKEDSRHPQDQIEGKRGPIQDDEGEEDTSIQATRV